MGNIGLGDGCFAFSVDQEKDTGLSIYIACFIETPRKTNSSQSERTIVQYIPATQGNK